MQFIYALCVRVGIFVSFFDFFSRGRSRLSATRDSIRLLCVYFINCRVYYTLFLNVGKLDGDEVVRYIKYGLAVKSYYFLI